MVVVLHAWIQCLRSVWLEFASAKPRGESDWETEEEFDHEDSDVGEDGDEDVVADQVSSVRQEEWKTVVRSGGGGKGAGAGVKITPKQLRRQAEARAITTTTTSYSSTLKALDSKPEQKVE